MPQSLRSKVDELADLIFGIIQAAELAKPIGRRPAEWSPAVVEFPKSIDRAIDGVGLLDGFGRPVGGVELPVWLDGLRAALLQLKSAYLTHGHKLFGDRAGVLHPLLKAVSRCSSDLRRLHVSQDTDAVKPKAARKPREPAKRRKRIPSQTGRQREALDIYDREKTFAAVAKHFDITDTGARDLVLRAKATIEAIAAETKRLLAERSSGRSVKPDQKLPEDKHGQVIVSGSKRHGR